MKIKYAYFLLLFAFIVHADQNDDQKSQINNPSQMAVVPQGFLLGPCVFGNAYTLFCGAGSEGAGDFTLSQFNGASFISLVRSQLTLNHEPCEKNPFYDKEITHLKPVFNLPLFMVKNDQKTIYYLSALPNQEQKISALSVTNINDANGKPCNGILDFTFAETTTSSNPLWYLFAAVKGHDGVFGSKGSGIALLKFKARSVQDWRNKVPFDEHQPEEPNEEKDDKPADDIKFFINTMDAQQGILGGNKAVPFDSEPSDQPLIQINGGLDYINEHAVDLFWEDNFNRLYIALQVKTKDDARSDQGACALLVGQLWNDVLTLRPIVPGSVFSPDAENIIGAVGPGNYVSLHKVRALHSTTGTQYLIVVGGNGKPEETHNKVFALPMSNMGNQHLSFEELYRTEKHGSVAKRAISPSKRFFPGRFGRFIGRYLDEVAHDPHEFYTAQDKAVRVGGDSELPGAIKEIFTARDCVIVFIDQDAHGQEAGAFYSQAIFDHHGCIAAWSTWKRIQGSSAGILALSIDHQQFAFTFFEQMADRLVFRVNEWRYDSYLPAKNEKNLSQLVREVLPQHEYGVQGLFDFDYAYPGLSSEVKSSLLIATGNKKVLLIQTGVDDQKGIFRARRNFNALVYRNNGLIGELLPENTDALVIEGGVLKELGPLTSAEIACLNGQSWLIVGGAGGVAVLADKEGRGWLTADGIGKSFSSLKPDLIFQKIGNYSFVQKLRAYNDHLYVLTDEKLDCISLSGDFQKNVKTKTLVTKNDLNSYFSDVLISEACILMATGCGLFFGAEDIINAPGSLSWQKIELPGLALPIQKFFTITSNNRESEFINKGQVYVLSGSVASAQGEVHRLYLDNGQIQFVHDYGFTDFVSRFISFGGFRTNFATDGLIHLSTRSVGNPLIHLLPAFVAGKAIASSKGYAAQVEFGHVSNIRYITKNSATGSWLVGGDFGLCSYE